MAEDQRVRFDAIIRADPDLMALLRALRGLRLPQWRPVRGCLYQNVLKRPTHTPRGTGIQDYDLAYFDASDLSWEAEDRVIQEVVGATRDGVGPVQARNQARVHLWFEARFGCPYPPLSSADEALARYAARVHALGVRLEDDDRLEVVAPFGLDDLFTMVIRPNAALDNHLSYARKAERAKAIWPEVTVLPWSAA